MTYRSLMVHLDLEQVSEPALRITCEFADRFKSRVIGVTAGLPTAAIHADGMIATSVLEVDYEQLNQAIGHCEAIFDQRSRTSAIHWNGAPMSPILPISSRRRLAPPICWWSAARKITHSLAHSTDRYRRCRHASRTADIGGSFDAST